MYSSFALSWACLAYGSESSILHTPIQQIILKGVIQFEVPF